MAITLLSPPATAVAKAAASNASSTTATGTDASATDSPSFNFASLFIRQLSTPALTTDSNKGLLGNHTEKLPDSDESNNPGDLAALLAAAGLLTQPVPPMVTQTLNATTSPPAATGDALSSGGTQGETLLAQLGAMLGQQGKATSPETTLGSDTDTQALLNTGLDDTTANSAATSGANTNQHFAETLAAQQALQQGKSAETQAAPPTLPVNTPVTSPRWSQEVGAHMVWMTRNDTQQAQLTLNPPNLGPVQVSLSLNNDQLTAQFVAPSPEVRQALEESLPRLREMLAGSGIQLGQANVGSESFQQQQAFRDNPATGDRQASRLTGDNAILGTPLEQGGAVNHLGRSALNTGNGRLDLFV